MTFPEILECDRLTISPVLLSKTGETSGLLSSLFKEPSVQVCDELEGQLSELIELQNPSIEYSQLEMLEAIEKHLKGVEPADYGVWVYYPWLKKLVHLLDEEEFVECRTNRNKYKITAEEQEILSTKVVGVVGLSVGQSVSITMAMERSFGELRIADFDDLELTNLNRIRTGVQNLGLPKTTIVAREIAEIDPFLKVTVFGDGLTEENVEEFLTSGQKMDLLIDECDGLYMKYHMRVRAKALGIPVVMDTSDNGLIDIERFDLDPDYKLFHGLIDHLNFEESKGLKKNEDKVPFVLPIMGLETVSLEMKASMVEIDQSITTWPQLASSVVYGGGMTGDLSRRLLLGEEVKSGRFYIDPISIIRNQPLAIEIEEAGHKIDDTSEEPVINTGGIKKLIELCALAPSSGNMQPWLFRWDEKNNLLEIVLKKKLETSFGDYRNRASIVSIGCALKNLTIGLTKFGWRYNMELTGKEEMDDTIAVVEIFQKPKSVENLTFPLINDRHTTRLLSCYQDIPSRKIQVLKDFASQNLDQGLLQIVSNRDSLTQLGEIIAQADIVRFLNLACHEEFYTEEVRWNDKEAKRTGDGLDMSKFYLNPSEYVGFKVAQDGQVIEKLNEWKVEANAFGKLARKAAASCGAMGFISVKSNFPEDFVKGGMLAQSIWLKATELGLGFQPLSSPPYFFSRLINGEGVGFTPKEKLKLESAYRQFKNIFKINESHGFVMLFRLVAIEDNSKSYRKPLKDVFTEN